MVHPPCGHRAPPTLQAVPRGLSPHCIADPRKRSSRPRGCNRGTLPRPLHCRSSPATFPLRENLRSRPRSRGKSPRLGVPHELRHGHLSAPRHRGVGHSRLHAYLACDSRFCVLNFLELPSSSHLHSAVSPSCSLFWTATYNPVENDGRCEAFRCFVC